MEKADHSADTSMAPEPARSKPTRRKSISMHDDVPVWCDCCSCEAEPYWVEAMEQDLKIAKQYAHARS